MARQLQDRHEIVSFSSLGQVLNDPHAQREVIAALAPGFSNTNPIATVKSSLVRAGFATEPFRDYLDGLAGLARLQPRPVSEGRARLADSPFRGIIERHLVKDGSGYHLLVYLNYRGPEFRQAAFLNALNNEDPRCRVTSVDLVSRQLTESVRKSFVQALFIGGALVLFLLLSHFNSPAGIFSALFPVFSGVIAMLGLMALFGMRLNFMNVMVLVTILGMASDYGLHIAHRVRNCAENEHEGRFIQSGRAVLLSALTTIAGFGSLAFTDYGALASIGWATNFGIAATTLFTLASLPAFMHWFSSMRRGGL